MGETGNDRYDVVIIGAGIGGLVCGCYLAKAGMKVLVVEQHNKPGGYCTSFQRKGFSFDAAANALGSFKDGVLGAVFQDLDLHSLVNIRRYNPTGRVVTKQGTFTFWNDVKDTVHELIAAFPDEGENISRFFGAFTQPDPHFIFSLRHRTLKNLMDVYVQSETLKTVFSCPLFMSTGVVPSKLSAVLAFSVIKEFVLDGGYHPEGGMQALSDAFAARYATLGGDLRLSCKAEKIITHNRKIEGVVLADCGYIKSPRVVSNIDARQTFLHLLEPGLVPLALKNDLASMIPTESLFLLYLGLNGEVAALPEPCVNTWVLSSDMHGSRGADSISWNIERTPGYLLHLSPDKRSLTAVTFAPFETKQYWKDHKHEIAARFLRRIESDMNSSLSAHVVLREAASPQTLYRYTSNAGGSAYGWLGIPSQIARFELQKPSFVEGLYLAGHWSTIGMGIPGVAYSGRDTALRIIRGQNR
jgi:phytoene dehydrogenase-like protein